MRASSMAAPKIAQSTALGLNTRNALSRAILHRRLRVLVYEHKVCYPMCDAACDVFRVHARHDLAGGRVLRHNHLRNTFAASLRRRLGAPRACPSDRPRAPPFTPRCSPSGVGGSPLEYRPPSADEAVGCVARGGGCAATAAEAWAGVGCGPAG